MGVRLDAGTAFSGAMVTPFYDSLLVKVTAWGPRFTDAARRMERGLQEFRIRGVKTNIPFLINLVTHPKFIAGGFTTRFIDETPELFDFVPRQDRATKLFTLPGRRDRQRPSAGRRRSRPRFAASRRPCRTLDHKQPIPAGTRQKLLELGPEKFCKWILEQKQLLLTDTTFRDAHQSLLATRVRTYDMLAIADAYARLCPQLFSIEMWGGATFDTAMRFLEGVPLAAAGRPARADSQHPVPDAAARLERVGLLELSRQRGQGVRRRSRPRPASTCSASSIRSTGCRT